MNPGDLSDPEAQGALLKRLRAEARRWLLRGVLLLVMAMVSLRTGGSLYIAMGIAFAALAVMAYLMSRRTAKASAELKRRMEQAAPLGIHEDELGG